MDAIRKQHIETLRNVGDHIEFNKEYGGIYYTSAFVQMIEYVLELLEEPKQMTNADRIRGMSDDELAAFLTKHDVEQNRLRLASRGIVATAVQLAELRDRAYSLWTEWLRQPVQSTTDVPDAHEHSGLLEE